MFVRVNDLGALTRAFRNISRRKIRVLLIVIALGFSMAIMISIPTGIIANQASAVTLAENFSITVTNMQEEINKTATLIECQTSSGAGGGRPSYFAPGASQQVFISETAVDEIHSIQGVVDAVPFLQARSNETTSQAIGGFGGRNFTISRPLYTITGVPLNASLIENYSILPANVTDGRNLREGDSGVLVMSSNLTDYFGVGVGGTVKVYGDSFTVVGIYEQASQGFTGTQTVCMSIDDAQRATGNVGNMSRIDVYADTTSDVDGIAQVIQAAYPELSVTTYEDRLSQLQNMQTMYNETLTNAQSTLDQTQTVATQEIIIAVAATSLIILFVMLYTVRERTKEIGTLKAIGFSNWSVMSQFVLEGVFMSAAAAAVGIAIATVGAPVFLSFLLPRISQSGVLGAQGRQAFGPGSYVQSTFTAAPDPQLMLLMFGAALLLGAVGSLYPAWRASKTSPMEALRHE
jgi:putative ABC transport system permease protein